MGLRAIAVLGLAAIPLNHAVLTRLLAIVETVRTGDPFVAANAYRLRAIAWALLALQLLSLVIGAVANAISTPAHPVDLDAGFSVNGWLAVLLTAIVKTTVDAVVPGIGLNYAARPEMNLFAGVHRGFAPPGPGAADGTDVEQSVNYELGTRLQRGGVRTEVVGFFNDYANLLGRDTLATGGTGEGTLFNGGTAQVYGVEASGEWNPAPAMGLTSALPIRLTYTLGRLRIEGRRSFTTSDPPYVTSAAGGSGA